MSEKFDHKTIFPKMKISPKIFPGRLSKENKGAIDWHHQNLVAFGSQSYIVILEPLELSIVQTLDEHRGQISLSSSSLTESASPSLSIRSGFGSLKMEDRGLNKLKLVSGDHLGCLMVWNVLEGSVIRTFSHELSTNKSTVMDVDWVESEENEHILSLHSNGSLFLWDVSTGDRLWKIDLPRDEAFTNICFNPFDEKVIAIASAFSGSIYFLRDFAREPAPSNVTLRLSISSAKQVKPDEPPIFRQMLFSPHYRDLAYFVLSREIIIFDLKMDRSLATLSLDRSKSSFFGMAIDQNEPHLLFCLHEDGGVTAWKQNFDSYRYERICSSEVIRAGRARKKGFSIMGLAKSPLIDDRLLCIGNDGTLWMWSMMRSVENSSVPRFCVTGVNEPISSNISSFSACPFGEEHLQNCVAIGTVTGTIQIVDLNKLISLCEFLVFSNQAIRGIKWVSEYEIMFWIVEEVGKIQFQNKIGILDIRTGKQKEIRKISGSENTFIRAIKLSYARQYFIVLLKDRPFELWDLKTLTLIRTLKPFTQITALEWFPHRGATQPETNGKPVKEQFIFTLPDSSVKYYTVENKVLATNDITVDVGPSWVSALAWKDDFIVSGDTQGDIHVWNTKTNKSQTFTTQKGMIKRIYFSSSLSIHQILVLFNEGDIGIWDLDHNVRVSASTYLKGRDLKAIDCDWISESIPVVATTDGCLRVLDRSMSISNSPIVLNDLPRPIISPYLLPPQEALQLRILLSHYVGSQKFLFATRENMLPDHPIMMLRWLQTSLLKSLETAEGIAKKALITAQFYGSDIRFWNQTLIALSKFRSFTPPPRLRQEEISSSLGESLGMGSSTPTKPLLPLKPLSTVIPTPVISSNSIISSSSSSSSKFFNASPYLFESQLSRDDELNRANTHQKSKPNYDQLKKISALNLQLGRKNTAMEILMETPIENPSSRFDYFKSLVIAGSMGPETFNNTIKWVSTHLIANSSLDEGVELLCLIGKGLDACRYLQTYDRWADAAHLAKTTLNESECGIVLKRWANHLATGKLQEKMKAVEILLSLGEFYEALHLLYKIRRIDLAAPLIVACVDSGLLPTPIPDEKSPLLPLSQLLNYILLDYSALLSKLNLSEAAEFYTEKLSLFK